MTELEAEQIYLKWFPRENDCYWDIVWSNRNGWNFKRYVDGGEYCESDLIHEVQIRNDKSIYLNGKKML